VSSISGGFRLEFNSSLLPLEEEKIKSSIEHWGITQNIVFYPSLSAGTTFTFQEIGSEIRIDIILNDNQTSLGNTISNGRFDF